MSRCRAAIAAVLAALLAAAAPPSAVEEAPAAQGPVTTLERGLWLYLDMREAELRASRFLVRDAALNAYVRALLCRTVGEARCAPLRIYIVRNAGFNASAAPNGMIELWTGLLLRTESEAELMAVLGHELGHFEARHTLRLAREARRTSDAALWVQAAGLPGSGYALYGLMGHLPAFSRDQEREADRRGFEDLAAAGFRSLAAAELWERMLAEADARAAARGTPARPEARADFLDDHPAVAERAQSLRAAARVRPGGGEDGRESYRRALAPWRDRLLADQIARHDRGGSDYLIGRMAAVEGWTAPLLEARGDVYRGDAAAEHQARALRFYRAAIDTGAARPEAWRGLGLAALRIGRTAEAAAALRAYLRQRPDAPDAALLASLIGDAP
ncbi:M48 family metallopeptidase [Sphingomonas morindae]|uniref:M48 family metallopeptidase n=1 Tax=Sphingomonas morindae TaxID=1541170 RepID=A0ABY4X8J1_9SPHN|nr:M48 family metallopeptidase [Sphingomonas morindae]USI73203.1 M48 family metallopeptidase [Sphingomonas morindae]